MAFLLRSGTRLEYMEGNLLVLRRLGTFQCHTKYNDRGENCLNNLAKDDEEGVAMTAKSRREARKNRANEKDEVRSIETAQSGIFGERGLNIDTRIQIIEMAQF